jgi:hypothetical protein
MFHRRGEFFLPGVYGAVSSDSANTKFLHCAAAAQADYIVTSNKRYFPQPSFGWREL